MTLDDRKLDVLRAIVEDYVSTQEPVGSKALVERHKREFTARLVKTTAEAGARDPETLGRQLAVLFEGARALSTSLNDRQPYQDVRELAETLINQATGPI